MDLQPTIIHVRNKATNTILHTSEYDVKKVTSQFSNTKEPIYKLVVNDTPISRNNTYTVRYQCQTCSCEQEITLNLYMRKLNRNTQRCASCVNKDEAKMAQHALFMLANSKKIISGNYSTSSVMVKSRSVEDHVTASVLEWENENDDFKDQYLLCHLSIDDYNRIKPKIVGINHGKYTDLSDWEYFPYYRIYNQTRYTPMLIQRSNNLIEKPRYITFKCDNCDAEYIHRDIEVVKNQYKLLCQTCSLTNRIFRLRKFTCKSGDTVMWQSMPERRFIEWCEEHNISINNGPSIEYRFRDKTHTYRVDFELPSQKMLIEIKDNHCWHKEQVATGKFGAKEESAKKWCMDNGYTYHVVFPKTLQVCKDSILKQIL